MPIGVLRLRGRTQVFRLDRMHSSVSPQHAQLHQWVLCDKRPRLCRIRDCLELFGNALRAVVSGVGSGQTVRLVSGAKMRNAARDVFGRYAMFPAHQLSGQVHGEHDVRAAMRHDVSAGRAAHAGALRMCVVELHEFVQLTFRRDPARRRVVARRNFAGARASGMRDICVKSASFVQDRIFLYLPGRTD